MTTQTLYTDNKGGANIKPEANHLISHYDLNDVYFSRFYEGLCRNLKYKEYLLVLIDSRKKEGANEMEMAKLYLHLDDVKKNIRAKLNKMENYKFKERNYCNKVVDAGRDVLADLLANGGTTGNGDINYLAVGTGSSAPANSDTTLETEFFRQTVTDISASSNIVTVNTTIGAGDANTQLYEAGEFIDATATANSGTLWARFNIDENKTSGTVLTISSTYTITQ